jgi:esterase/lipase superfamily enzyme
MIFVVKNDSLLFAAPDRNSPNHVGSLAAGEIVQVIEEIGGWFKIRVPDQNLEGFLPGVVLELVEPPDANIDKEQFFAAATRVADASGINRQYLYALAAAESGVKNIKSVAAGSDAFGPFQFSEARWDDLIGRFGEEDQITAADRFDPFTQVIMAARYSSSLAQALKTARGHDPTLDELYLTYLLGQEGGLAVLEASPVTRVDTALAAKLDAASVRKLFADNPGILQPDGQVITVSQALDATVAALLPGLDEAAQVGERLNPSEVAISPRVSDAPSNAEKAEYVVWYGTNRRPHDPSDISKGYSSVRDTAMHYGSCRVFVPESHKIGSIGSPWWKRLLTMTDDRLRLLAITEVKQSAYWSEVAAHLADIEANERNALIFIHGYNVSFENAALRSAQIGLDLSIKGAMAFFSWPSHGSLRGYPADAATIEASEGVIEDFMTEFADRSGANAVHVIAHSMGNRGVLRAVNEIARKAERRSGKPFAQIMLAAADVDADTFRRLSAAYVEVASRTTLYVSTRDLAVGASHWLYSSPRAGLMPPTLVLPEIDTINVTNVDLTMLGHGYIASARGVLEDMHALIKHGEPPDKRFGLRATRNEQGERFWLIGA